MAMTTSYGPATVRTTYTGPTDFGGSKIVARGAGRQASDGYRHELSPMGNHAAVAELLGRRIASAMAEGSEGVAARATVVEEAPRGYVFRVDYRFPRFEA